MRELKFKVWTGKEMIPWKNAWNTETKLPKQFGENKYLSIVILAMLAKSNNGFTALQFTGLQDKNGKDIYEGDIVSHLHSADTCVVVFQKETAMFLAQEIGDEKLGFGIDDVTSVIGNIYENQNLLK